MSNLNYDPDQVVAIVGMAARGAACTGENRSLGRWRIVGKWDLEMGGGTNHELS